MLQGGVFYWLSFALSRRVLNKIVDITVKSFCYINDVYELDRGLVVLFPEPDAFNRYFCHGREPFL